MGPRSVSELRDEVRQLTVTADSPDGAVRVSITSHGPHVEFRSGVVGTRCEQSAAAQVSAAVREAVVRYHGAAAEILGSVRDQSPSPDLPGAGRPVHEDLFADAVAEIAVSSASPRGQVTVDWRGADDVEVRIRPGAFALLGFTDDQLATEIHAALAAAIGEVGRSMAEVRAGLYRDEIPRSTE